MKVSDIDKGSFDAGIIKLSALLGEKSGDFFLGLKQDRHFCARVAATISDNPDKKEEFLSTVFETFGLPPVEYLRQEWTSISEDARGDLVARVLIRTRFGERASSDEGAGIHQQEAPMSKSVDFVNWCMYLLKFGVSGYNELYQVMREVILHQEIRRMHLVGQIRTRTLKRQLRTMLTTEQKETVLQKTVQYVSILYDVFQGEDRPRCIPWIWQALQAFMGVD